jgi:hypothetical protein
MRLDFIRDQDSLNMSQILSFEERHSVQVKEGSFARAGAALSHLHPDQHEYIFEDRKDKVPPANCTQMVL